MSITAYSKYRRLKLRAAWELAGMAVWCKEVGLYILAFVASLLVVQIIADKAIAEDEAYAAQQKTAHIEQTWLSCLNHKGVFVDGELHTCSLANTRFAKADFK